MDVTTDDGRITLRPKGEIDAASVPALRAALEPFADQAGTVVVVVDLSGVTFMDSSGVGALAVAHRALADRDGQLILCGVHGMITRLLSITGLDQTIRIE